MTDEPGAGPLEIELKYAVREPEALEATLERSLRGSWGPGTWRTVHVEDRYVDTDEGALERQGFGARLRLVDGRALVTVKSEQATGAEPVAAGSSVDAETGAPGGRALRRRVEHEAPASPDLDPTRWPRSTARELVTRLSGGAALRTRFVIRQRRREREVGSPAAGAKLTIDRAEVLVEERSVGSFNVLEVESLDGSTELLERLARVIEAIGSVAPDQRSKEVIAAGLVRAATGLER